MENNLPKNPAQPPPTPVPTPPASEYVAPSVPVVKPKSKVPAILFAVLISAAIFGVGVYYLNQKSKSTGTPYGNEGLGRVPTSTLESDSDLPGEAIVITPPNSVNLKDYTNSELGLSFKYPSSYELAENLAGGYDIYLFDSEARRQDFEKCLSVGTPECNLYNIGIRVVKHAKSKDQTLEEFYTQIGGSDLGKAENAPIDGHPALTFESEGIGLIYTTYIDLGENALEIFGNLIVDSQNNIKVYKDLVGSMQITL